MAEQRLLKKTEDVFVWYFEQKVRNMQTRAGRCRQEDISGWTEEIWWEKTTLTTLKQEASTVLSLLTSVYMLFKPLSTGFIDKTFRKNMQL
mmetsp:Transcript_6479/g.8520  ORF Transcript_6479/g.8520 Transcript_6479/m.8520 type:complete len:91 (-) Transcript_6479:460-732(-)